MRDPVRDQPWTPLGMPDVVVMVGPPQSYRGNLHDELKIVWASHGYLIQRRAGSYRAGPEQLIVLHPGEAHSGHPTEEDGAEWRIACVPRSLVAKVTDPDGLRFEPPVLDAPDLTARFLAVFDLFEQPRSRAEREDGLIELVADLVPHAAPVGPPDPLSPTDRAAAEQAMAYLGGRLSANITLDELAEVTTVDRYRLVRACTARFGLPPHTLHLRLRLDRARHLIREGRRLSDVGQETGFHDQAHFSRTFTRVYGLTPTQYRAAWTGTGPHTKLTADA